jgi:SlyX protein
MPITQPDTQHLRKLETATAHLTRTVEDLSDIVARQQSEIDVLTRRVHLLVQREAEREAEREQSAGGGEIMGDGRPPHW